MSITQRIDAVTLIPEAYRAAVIPMAPSMKIEVGSAACNYACSYCVRSIRKTGGEMDRKTYRRIVKEFIDAGGREVGVFFINEPFLCSWLDVAVADAKELGAEYTFCTSNFSAATPEKLERVMRAGLDSLKFSCNYYSAEQFKQVANVTPRLFHQSIAHFKAARNIRDAGGYKTKLYASSILFDGEQRERMEKVLEEVRPFADETYFLPLFGMGGATKEHGMRPTAGNPGRVGAERPPLPCWSVSRELHVTADAKLAACCFGTGVDGDLIMGDLNKQSLVEAWNSEPFQRLREAHLRMDVSGTPCEECVAYR